MTSSHEPTKALIVKCPQCGKSIEWCKTPTSPFCSKRCQTLDQAAWATEDYCIRSLPDESSLSEDEPN